MPPIQWTPAMSVGMQELDDDHKVLIDVINRLETNAAEGAQPEVARSSLMSLRRYAEFHFAREEKVMTACEFPGIGVQKSEHHDFIERIREVTGRFDTDPESAAQVVNKELLDYLKSWLSHHILIEDMAYRPFVERSAAAKQAAKSFRAAEVWWS